MNTSLSSRAPMVTMTSGLVLTVVATVVPFVGRPPGSLIAEHLRAGYPGYSESQIAAAVGIYLIALTVVGALGVVTWIVSMLVARRYVGAARWVCAAAFVVGTGIALFDASIRDTSGDTGLPLPVGVLGLLPSIAGAVALVLVWRRAGNRAPRTL
ncbi:hypothetical protein GCM10009840_05760 [Pseudolysinimonas kribbensis]|uniref:hypothetical protein n=1 Tax=Pseudolysinimonas kribbensis TaxID=433641 RepID=UPI0031E35BD0